ncbi:hypothetical protein PUN28_007847 [Cardiocondyla obscurior]|uniref:Leucine-rich repeat protein n=1 Tax=Cardiocondyla obscurior TaxID=286306 RepID=A0AAW2FY73_9HYME
MSRAPFFILVCVSIFVDATIATCTVSKNEIEYGERLACSNVTLSTALISGGPLVSNVIIFQSQIRNIPDRSFLKYNRTLVSLNLLNCSIRNISDGAFHGLRTLKKLGLSHNYITSVRDQWFFNLTSLEQLDLSHNLISTIEPTVFEKLQRLKRLDLSENRLTCLEPAQLVPMSGLEKLLFSGNPLTFRCRGTVSILQLSLNKKRKKKEKKKQINKLSPFKRVCYNGTNKTVT